MGALGADLANGCFMKGVEALKNGCPSSYQREMSPSQVSLRYRRALKGLGDPLGGILGSVVTCLGIIRAALLLAWGLGLASPGTEGRAKQAPQKPNPGATQ